MKKIDTTNKVFLLDEFQKDKYKFNLIFKNLTSNTLELYSDEENYIVCRGRKDLPTWIWTKNDLGDEKVLEIQEVMNLYLTDNEKDKFTCKKGLYDKLVINKYTPLNDDYFEMGFLICNTPIKPKYCEGFLTKPNEEDKETLIKYWHDDSWEMAGSEKISYEQARIDVEKFYASQNFYVWKNNDNKIVCMVCYSVLDNQAKLAHVYTPIEERKKGYAANLIYNVTKMLLNNNLVPFLYTDYNYIPSNKAYTNAGYEDLGILINFSCSKSKVKTR